MEKKKISRERIECKDNIDIEERDELVYDLMKNNGLSYYSAVKLANKILNRSFKLNDYYL
jgi:hypothetical protein